MTTSAVFQKICNTLALLAAFVVSNEAYAFRLTPMSIAFDPQGSGASKSFVIENDSTEKTAIQITMAERRMKIDGSEDLPLTSDFTVFPKNLLLKGGEKKTVRVTWKGNPNPPTELAYRIVAEQLPVDGLSDDAKTKSKMAQIRVLLRFQGSVYIEPSGMKPDVKVTSVNRMDQASEKIKVTLMNSGSKHALLENPVLKVSSGNQSVALKAADLPKLVGQNILVNTSRSFDVERKEGFPKGDLTAELEINP